MKFRSSRVLSIGTRPSVRKTPSSSQRFRVYWTAWYSFEVGRKAGISAGYAYSDAMKNSGIVWDETTLADYNRDPKGKVPGTKMLYNGVKNAGQLADLVAYLKEATK